MKALALATLAALVLLCGGCAKYYWTKPDTVEAEFARDSYECAREATGSEATYRACLIARGYRRDKYLFAPTPHWRGVTE